MVLEMKPSHIHSMFIALLLSFSVSFSMSSQAEPLIYTSFFSDQALSGYDTVAYFRQGKPVEGDEKFSFEYKGAQWLFSSQSNLDAFILSPESYAPQYGGYCAWAAADGRTASGDPLQWTIINNKLYLNYNAAVKADWLKDAEKFIIEADNNWPALLK